MPVVMILCLALCFTGVTWAWFTGSTAISTDDIVSAYYETTLTVLDQNGNEPEKDADGNYILLENVRYTATITTTDTTTASTGFATFTVNGVQYNSVQIPKGESISFDIYGYNSVGYVDSSWGTGSQTNPVIDEDVRFIKSQVKLVPKDENSTVMIERNGVVETNVETNNKVSADDIYGVTDVIDWDEDMTRYAENTTYEEYYIYGLETNKTVEYLDDMITVTGGGTYKVYDKTGTTELEKTAVLGTGVKVKVFNGDQVVEEFYVIIYGDIDGNGRVNVNDASRVEAEGTVNNWSLTTPYLLRAADLAPNGRINVNDVSYEDSAATLNGSNVDQVKGTLIS